MNRVLNQLTLLLPALAAVMFAVPQAAAQSTTCHEVQGDRITAADLAGVLPVFAAVPPETVFGYAPEPGAYRNIEPAELTRFAAAHGLLFHSTETVCFEPALSELKPLAIEDAVRTSLGAMSITGAEIEVVEFSKFRVPSGKLTFPVESFPAYTAGDTAIWNGFVVHENRRYSVWARVRITVAQTRLVAAASLRAGQRIEASDLRLEDVRAFPSRETSLKSISDGAGMLAKRYVNVGTALTAADVMPPWDVGRGDMTTVQVRSGGAVLTLEAEAQADGRAGQSIDFRNATTGKIFRAKITGKGRALLEFPATGA